PAGSIQSTAVTVSVYTPDFLVDTTSDANLAICSPQPNDCSLRGAITLANSLSGTHTITFSPTVFAPGTITVTSPLPTVTGSINLIGAGKVTISGASSYRMLVIHNGAVVNLSGLTLTQANSNTFGGAINNDGTLTISSSSLISNAAGDGGGLY